MLSLSNCVYHMGVFQKLLQGIEISKNILLINLFKDLERREI